MSKDNSTVGFNGDETIDLTAVFGGTVEHLDISREFPAEQDTLPSDCEAKGPIAVRGALDNLSGYMRLTLDISLEYDTVCARCLKPLTRAFILALDKTVAARETVEDEDSDEVVSDYIVVDGNKLNIAAVVREQIYLEFPFRQLCSEECRGLCPKCGKNLNEGDCGCPKKELDPRLEVLAELLRDGGEVTDTDN